MLSLAVLDEAIDHASRGPAIKSLGLRAALAAVWWLGDQKDRECFDAFWRIVTGKDDLPNAPETTRNYVRASGGRRELHGICRSLGFEYSNSISTDLLLMRGKLPGHREKVARHAAAKAAMQRTAEDAFAVSVRERRERDEARRKARDCGWM